jgi:hypothetical protein
MKVSEKMQQFEYELYEALPAGGIQLGDHGRCQLSKIEILPEQLVPFESRKILECPLPQLLRPQMPQIINVNIKKVIVRAFKCQPPN